MPVSKQSPIERWPGTVTFSKPLTLFQVAEYHKGVLEARRNIGEMTQAMLHATMLPGIYACIERFDLKNWEGLTPELFPSEPLDDALRMAQWLDECVAELIVIDDAPVPKASAGTPTPTPSEKEQAPS